MLEILRISKENYLTRTLHRLLKRLWLGTEGKTYMYVCVCVYIYIFACVRVCVFVCVRVCVCVLSQTKKSKKEFCQWHSVSLKFTASNVRLIKTLQEPVVASCQTALPAWPVSGRVEETNGRAQSGWQIHVLRFSLVDLRIQNRLMFHLYFVVIQCG